MEKDLEYKQFCKKNRIPEIFKGCCYINFFKAIDDYVPLIKTLYRLKYDIFMSDLQVYIRSNIGKENIRIRAYEDCFCIDKKDNTDFRDKWEELHHNINYEQTIKAIKNISGLKKT